MTQGYFTLGVDDTGKTKNISAAYALCASLKLADPARETAVMVFDKDVIPAHMVAAFDHIVETPFGRTDVNHSSVMMDAWQSYHITPFDETIFLNPYSLAIDNLDSLWFRSQFDEIVFGTSVDFRKGIGTETGSMIYFRKNGSTVVEEFFKLLDPVSKGWRDVYLSDWVKDAPTDYDFDVIVNTARRMQRAPYSPCTTFTYTDLKLSLKTPDGSDIASLAHLTTWYRNHSHVLINNHLQSGILSYHDAEFLTQEIFSNINDDFKNTQIAEI